jgi:hypothetical protein
MGSVLNLQHSKQTPSWRFLYRPMLAFSLLLHGLVLLLPLPSQPEDTPEEKEEEAELQIMNLAPLAETPPPPSPTPAAPSPKPQPAPVAAAPPPVVRSRPNPVPNPNPAPTPTPTPTTTSNASAAPAPATDLANEETTEAIVPAEEQEFQDFLGEFQTGLDGLGAAEAANVGIPYYNFPQPEAFFTAESIAAADRGDSEPELQSGAVTFIWASRRRPSEVLSALQERFAGFEINPMTEYGGGDLYEVKKGDTIRYISLVRAKDRTATFVVIWSRDPNAPIDESVSSNPPG